MKKGHFAMEEVSVRKRSYESISTTQGKLLVPANGNCFFTSVILSYLLSVIHDPEAFNSRLGKIVDFNAQQQNDFREDLFQHHKNLAYLHQDKIFTAVIKNLKERTNIPGWGGSREDIHTTERLLEIKIIELVEDEIPDDKAKDDESIPRVFIQRCAPIPEEVSYSQDDPLLLAAKMASAQASGEHRHFRVIDYNDVINDSITFFYTDIAERHTKKMALPQLQREQHEHYEEKIVEASEAFEVSKSSEISEASKISERSNNVLSYFSQTLLEFARRLDFQLCELSYDISTINWTNVHQLLNTSFTERLNYVKTFLRETVTDTPDEKERESSDKNHAKHSQHVFQGALFALNGEFEKALAELQIATRMPHFSLHKLPHLWILDIYFRQNKFQAIIEHIEKNHLTELYPMVKYSGALYPFFTFLGLEIIQQHFLNFSHFFYPQSEFDYFYMAARNALKIPAENSFASIYMQRANSCLLSVNLDEAIENYNRVINISDENDKPEALFQKAFALMISGRFEEARPCFEEAIRQQNYIDLKIYYLTFYIDICWKMGETGFAREFREDVLSLNLDQSDLIIKLKFSLINLKILLSDKNPSFQRIQRAITAFANLYKELCFEERDEHRFINDFFDILGRCVKVYARNKQLEFCKNIILFVEQTYSELMSQIAEDANTQLNTPPCFPNWCYDRVFINYQIVLLTFYAKLKLSEKINADLLENLGLMVCQIPDQFKKYDIRTGQRFFGGAGNDIEILRLILNTYERLIPSLTNVHQEINHQFPQPNASVGDTPPENQDGNLEAINNLDFRAFLEFAGQRTIEIMRCDILKHSFYKHLEFMREVFFEYIPGVLRLRLSNFTLKLTENPLDYENTNTFCTKLCQDLDAYHDFITQELLDPLLIYIFRKNLSQYFIKTLIHSLNNLLNLCNKIPLNTKKTLLPLIDQLMQKIKRFVENCQTERHPLRKLSLELAQCQRKYEKQVSAIQITQLERKLKQATDSLKRDELDVDYGKKIPFVVPFPREAITSRLKDYIKDKKINDKRNISAHYLTVVYSDETYKKGNPHTKCHVHIPIKVFDDKDDVVGSEHAKDSNDILSRIQLGWDIAHAQQMKNILTPEKPLAFNPPAHAHSEQHFFSYLNSHLDEIIEKIKNEVPQGCKIFMVSFDLGSIRTSCCCCRLSAVAIQAAQTEFVSKLQLNLKNKGFEIAGNKTPDGPTLKATTRILAQNPNFCDDKIPHENPSTKNIKYLKNFGIFQSQEPSVFISGKAENARKFYNQF